MPDLTLINNFSELVTSLKASGVPLRADEPQQLLQAPINAPPLNSVVFVRWVNQPPYLTMVLPVLDGITEARLGAIESAVCRANNGIPLPGFGIDYNHRAVVFKVSVPIADGVLASTLDTLFEGIIRYSRDFIMAFAKIAKEDVAPETIGKIVDEWVAADRAARTRS